MNQDVKKLWVDALRSGTYKQGTEYLHRTDNTFCCLGVLCDLYSRNVASVGWIAEHPADDNYQFGFTGEETYLPRVVTEWAELPDSCSPSIDVDVTIDGQLAGLTLHNDGDARTQTSRKTFDQIADAIEEQL